MSETPGRSTSAVYRSLQLISAGWDEVAAVLMKAVGSVANSKGLLACTQHMIRDKTGLHALAQQLSSFPTPQSPHSLAAAAAEMQHRHALGGHLSCTQLERRREVRHAVIYPSNTMAIFTPPTYCHACHLLTHMFWHRPSASIASNMSDVAGPTSASSPLVSSWLSQLAKHSKHRRFNKSYLSRAASS